MIKRSSIIKNVILRAIYVGSAPFLCSRRSKSCHLLSFSISAQQQAKQVSTDITGKLNLHMMAPQEKNDLLKLLLYFLQNLQQLRCWMLLNGHSANTKCNPQNFHSGYLYIYKETLKKNAYPAKLQRDLQCSACLLL